MTLTLQAIVAILATVAVALLLERAISRARVYVAREADRVSSATITLSRHSQIVQELVDGDDLDDEFKGFLLSLAEVVTDRQMAVAVLSAMVDLAAPAENDPAFDVYEERVRRLYHDHPKTAELFATAIRSAFAAMMLQWPETISLAQRYAARMSTDDANAGARAAVVMRRTDFATHTLRPLMAA